MTPQGSLAAGVPIVTKAFVRDFAVAGQESNCWEGGLHAKPGCVGCLVGLKHCKQIPANGNTSRGTVHVKHVLSGFLAPRRLKSKAESGTPDPTCVQILGSPTTPELFRPQESLEALLEEKGDPRNGCLEVPVATFDGPAPPGHRFRWSARDGWAPRDGRVELSRFEIEGRLGAGYPKPPELGINPVFVMP